jgi:hypothetical protein
MVDLEEQKIACKPRRVKKMPMKISYGVHQSIEFPRRLERSSLVWTAEFGGRNAKFTVRLAGGDWLAGPDYLQRNLRNCAIV